MDPTGVCRVMHQLFLLLGKRTVNVKRRLKQPAHCDIRPQARLEIREGGCCGCCNTSKIKYRGTKKGLVKRCSSVEWNGTELEGL